MTQGQDRFWPVIVGAGLSGCIAVLSPDASAQNYGPDKKRWELTADVAFFDNDIGVTVRDDTLPATAIDLEDDLGFDEYQTVWRLEGRYHFGKQRRNAIEIGYLGLDSTSRVALERDVTFDDTTYIVGGEVEADIAVSLLKAAYVRKLVENETYFVDANIGLFGVGLSAGISGSAFISDANATIGADGSFREETEFTFPLPTVGLSAGLHITPQLTFATRWDAFYVDVDALTGSFHDANATLTYTFRDTFSVGAGYQLLLVDMTVDLSGQDTTYESSFSGPMIRTRVTF